METLEYQYELVKKTTDKSHVMHFGNLTIAEEPVGWFQGAKKNGKQVNYIDNVGFFTGKWGKRGRMEYARCLQGVFYRIAEETHMNGDFGSISSYYQNETFYSSNIASFSTFFYKFPV